MVSPHSRTLLETIWAVQSKAVLPGSVIAEGRARARALEPWLRAFYHLPDEDKPDMIHAGPLAGVGVGVKDIIATMDMPTTNGSPIYAGFRPAADAWVAARIKAFGGVIFGKTVTTEFAWRHPGPTVNPWNSAHTPGGSSSGSAACVAACIVPLALGTQTVGSIIRPAAYNGVVGYKPSYGSIPRDGVHPLADSLDHVGFFTRDVADAAAAFALFVDGLPDHVVSPSAWRGHFQPKAPESMAVIRTGLWPEAEAAQRTDFEAQLTRLRAAGVKLIDFDPPCDAALMVEACNAILGYEAARFYGDLVMRHPAQTSARLQQLVKDGAAVSEAHYRAALALQAQWRVGLADWIAPCTAILTPPAMGPAPAGLAETGDARFCAPWTLLGVPAITIPSGWSPSGLPLGLQIVGLFNQDWAMLETASWVETLVGWVPRSIPARQ